MYSDFTMMAHGTNRPTQKERFRQRFMHKLVYFPSNNDGIYGCVGCGRCLAKCPISMNIVKVAKTLGRERNEMRKDPLIPMIGVVTDIRMDTPDVKTFRVVGLDGKKPFEHIPGQCAMLSMPGVGEALFSITSSPTNEDYLEFSIKKCGCVTTWLHAMEPGQQITIRGPYGNGFPVETELKGKDLLFIAGGIGLAPLRSVINYCPGQPRQLRHHRYRLRLPLQGRSGGLRRDPRRVVQGDGISVHLTIDREQEGWDGHVGFVPNYVKELNFDTSKTVVMCGPPIMIKFTLAGLRRWASPRPGLHHHGAEDEVRPGQVRPVQHRRQVCLQGRPRVPLGPDDELPDEY